MRGTSSGVPNQMLLLSDGPCSIISMLIHSHSDPNTTWNLAGLTFFRGVREQRLYRVDVIWNLDGILGGLRAVAATGETGLCERAADSPRDSGTNTNNDS